MSASAEIRDSLHECLVQYLPQAVVLVDQRLHILLANRAAYDLFRMAPGELIGLPLTALVPHPDLAKLILDFGEERLKEIEIHPAPEQEPRPKEILRITVVRLPPRGWIEELELAPSPECEPGDGFRLILLEDVTGKVEMEDQLVQTEKLAGMGQLASGIAHEMANPLSSMRANLQYVWEKLTEDGNSALIEAVAGTLEHLDQMRHLLRSLSEFTGQHRPRYDAADLNALIRRTLAFIGKEAEKHGVELAVSCAPALPFCHLDVRTIRQALFNMFKNALEAMPSGGRLRVTTRLAWAPDGGELAVVEIEDTGAGIEETELRKVFRPLYSTKPGGMGLGLPFCRQVVEEHGGEIHVTSQRGRGTTVTLTLPRYQEDAGREDSIA